MLSLLLSALLGAAPASAAAEGCIASRGNDGTLRDICVGTVVGANLRYGHSYWVGEVTRINIQGSHAEITGKALASSYSRRNGDPVFGYASLDADNTIISGDEVSPVVAGGCSKGICQGQLLLSAAQTEAYKATQVFANGQIEIRRGEDFDYGEVIDASLMANNILNGSSEALKAGETVMVMPKGSYVGYGTVVSVKDGIYEVKMSQVAQGSSMSCNGGGFFRNENGFDFSERLNDQFRYMNDRKMLCTKEFFRQSATVKVDRERVSRRVKCVDGRLCRGQWISFSTGAIGYSAPALVKGWVQYAGDNGLIVVRFIGEDGNIDERATTVKALRANGLTIL